MAPLVYDVKKQYKSEMRIEQFSRCAIYIRVALWQLPTYERKTEILNIQYQLLRQNTFKITRKAYLLILIKYLFYLHNQLYFNKSGRNMSTSFTAYMEHEYACL
jgi:hypothetical protein